VQGAAKLLLDPLFEADFDEDSYGFRPKRQAHQALDAVAEALKQGMTWVIDADISAYFDTIPQDRLMKAVARRVVDGAMLALVKLFLEAPIVDERDDGRPRRTPQGVPQGGVISPLLSNVYLDLLDRNFRRRVVRGELQGRLVRYADDWVLLTPGRPDREMAWATALMSRLGLTLNAAKTRVLEARSERFDFLSHTHRWRYGRVYLDVSKKALGRIRNELRRKTRRTWLSLDELIADLNPYIDGARRYFRRVRRRTLTKLDHFVSQRIARWWARKHKCQRPDWSLNQGGALWRQHGLERWNLPLALRPPDSRRAT
jgi:group II intron reverse transcriptase/maturase